MTESSDIKFRLLTYYIADLPLRDQRETMERPFFSLSKRKRLKPIDYKSPDGRIWIKISPHQDYGMATIWDADVLIWATSQLIDHRRRGMPLGRVLRFRPNELLRAIGRDYGRRGRAGGREYSDLWSALDRLKNTNISTNIRTLTGNKERRDKGSFSWIDEWRYVEIDGELPMMELELSRWVYEGVLEQGGVLSIDPDYFLIEGGLEKALYRIARKHVGQQEEFRIRLDTLYEKTGSDSARFEFRRMIKGIAHRNRLPGYHVIYKPNADLVVFRRRDPV
jgi:plasmid replication initiation protein